MAKMSGMSETEDKVPNTLILAGRVVGFIPPSTGQIEAMIRIGRSIRKGADDQPEDFWVTQIDRIGTLLESLIVEGDRETVDELYLTGKIDHAMLLGAIMKAVELSAVDSEDKAITKAKKANPARVARK